MKCQLKRLGAMLMAFVLVVTSGIMGIPTKVYAQTSKTDKMDVTEEEATKASGGLSISGNKLLDGNGKEIILRGVNIPHAWYPKYTKSSIEDIAALGSNAVRVVLSSGDAYTKNTKSELEDIIKWSKQTGQICILELHDFTGSSKDEDITQNAVSYWREMKDIINENKDYVILNIANEWCGQWKTGDLWADTYSQAIPALRNAGIENVIMVDTPGYGNEISVAAKDTNRILQSDPTGNTMFSAHVYGSFGKDASANDVGGTGEAIKAGLDQLTATGACYAIGEFGFWQNFDEVDERTLVDYCADHKIGWMAWSWAGNTGVEHEPLDMTSVKTFSKDDLTVWGKWVFGTKNGIQDTSVLAYSGKTYTGEKITGVPDSVPTPDIKIDGPVDNGGDDVEIQPGNLKDYHWLTGHEMVEGAWKELKFDQADDGVIKIDNLSAIKGADNTATFQTELKDKGEDWSSHKTIDLIVKNNNTVATMQLAFIMKCGVCLDDEGNPYPAWVQTRTLDPSDNTQFSGQPYVNVPHNKTTHIRFQIDEKSLDPMNPISAADAIRDVRSFGFRVMQGASGIVNGDLEILAMGFDWPDDKYAHEIAELNRPKNINRWSWEDVNGTEGTMVPTPDGDKISFAYTMVPKDDGSYCAVNNAQTNPGGKHDVGEDWSAYKSVSATVTNKGTDPVKLTFICKTSSNWTWAENYGKTATKPDTEETEIAPGESLDLTYSLVDPTWKTLNSQWEPTDSLKELNLVKALAWKVYSDSPSTGVIEVSNFSVNFGDGPQKTEPSTDPKPSEPSVKPSEKPSEPSEKPSQKVSEPSVQPSQKVSEPSVQPSQKPSEPSVQPSQKVSEPSVKPSQKVSEPSVKPSQKVSEPSVQPSQKVSEPSVQPSQKVSEPSVKPSQKPSEPSVQPSQKVSEPSEKPSQKPSEPSERPSQKPSEPSEEPSKDDTPSVERIYFSKNVITLNEGEKSEVVKVFAEMSDGKEENVDADKLVFTMEDETIASVTSEGIIKAQKSGQTILTAKMGKLRADCFIKVLQEQPSQPSEPSQSDKTLTVSQETVVLQAGESIALSADSDAEIIWETGNRLVVTVKSFSEGRIALVEAAENAPSTTVELFVSDGKTLKRISVTVIAKTTTEPSVPTPVEPVKTQLTLDKTSVSIHQKKKAKVVATVISDTLTAEDITVTTSDKKVAVAKNDNGTIIITAKKAGIAKITVNIKGVSSKKITVKVRPEKVTQIKKKILSKNSIQLKWKKQTDVTGYEVKILNKKKKLSYESCKLTGLKQKKKYKVMIRSYKSTKSGEVYSDTVTITVSTK